GQATLTTATLSTTSHQITATYNADSNYAASISPAITQSVNPANTTTTLSSSPNPSSPAQSVTFTATISVQGPGTTAVAFPGGTVTVFDNGVSIGTGSVST